MKKVLGLFMTLCIFMVLAACGDTETEEKEIGDVDSGAQAEQDNSSENESDENSETNNVEAEAESEETTYDEVLLDDDIAKVVLKGIETEKDEVFGDQHKIKMEIENKSDKTILVQSREVSIDGFMVDDMVMFSETVAAGKKANGSMDIMAFDEDLPELNENIEFVLLIADEETYMDISTTDVSVSVQ